MTRYVAQWLAVGLFAIGFALVVTFADPVGQVYAYPVLAALAITGGTVVLRRGVAPLVFAVAFVLALLPTAGVARHLGRDQDGRIAGACSAPVAAPFVAADNFGWTAYAPLGPGETRLSPQVLTDSGLTITLENYPTSFDVRAAQTCGQRAGQRLATSLAMVLVGVLLLSTTSRGPTADFRFRGVR